LDEIFKKRRVVGRAQASVQSNGAGRTESNAISVSNVVSCSLPKMMALGVPIFLFGSKSGLLAEEPFKIW